jgi:predicted transcriptional regulator of viral defense system
MRYFGIVVNTIAEKPTMPRGRHKLVSVIRAAGDVIHIDDVVRTLSVDRADASKQLSRWTKQGWLRRVGRGRYVPAALDLLESKHVLDDPWVLVPALYAPGYIGGRTAAEHWDLTEQLFRDIVVMTAQTVREKHQVRHGAQFTLYHIPESRIFGTKTVWRGRSKVQVSDIHRTIVDMLDNPGLGGGIQHVADCLVAYMKRSDRNNDALLKYAEALGNGAIFKRLGFLAEQRADPLAEDSGSRLTKGNARLDPALECSRLVSRWRLWVPESWVRGAEL